MNEHTQSGIYDLAQTPSGEIINFRFLLRFLENENDIIRPSTVNKHCGAGSAAGHKIANSACLVVRVVSKGLEMITFLGEK